MYTVFRLDFTVHLSKLLHIQINKKIVFKMILKFITQGQNILLNDTHVLNNKISKKKKTFFYMSYFT
jgi:S-adenosylmethionine:tRNA-ribosyltransferase-isomerase (queuine synthetase)